ncbi:MAG: carboxypeptidase-like regulatory domain-containing protein, partial [Bacteroidetes bacterium]|nr:carboxypeptidase-like regulatory domain-containing protein [Bacteroidota bacterium]
MRTLICCVAILSAASLGSTTVSVAQSQLPLLDAVRHFQSVWGVDLSYASNTLQGRYTSWSAPIAADAESDMEYLLEGTGVSFFRQPSGTFLLQPNTTQTATLTGQVRSVKNDTPLRGAHIALVGTQEGTTSNFNGHFALSTQPRRPAKIRISHIGYLTEEREVNLLADSVLTINVSLTEWILEERPLQVTATPLSSDFFSFDVRPYEMDTRGSADLRQITGLGTSDVVRNLRDIAGIYVDLNTSDIHIQGGGLGEHQFRLDESAVFEPIHLGLFGIFNPFAIDQVSVRKAGFNVEHGSYLAGIINAEHSLRAAHPIEVQIDPISFNARITNYMDIGPTNLSLMGAFRSSIWDHWWSNLRSESVNDLLREWNRPDEFLMRASIYPLKRAFEHGYNTLLDRL